MELYEELSELNEAKADTNRLIDFAGEALANRFLAIKNRLKYPENDLYYWIKNKSVDELAQVVSHIENTKSRRQLTKDTAEAGAKLVCETAHWKIYHITTFAASQKYGRDTQWCITGIDGNGDKYWNQYINEGIDFYFLITNGKYDTRGTNSKFAIAIYPDNSNCEIYNQQDTRVGFKDIPYYDEVSIPGIDISILRSAHSFVYCTSCGMPMEKDATDLCFGPDNNLPYCEDCYGARYFPCFKCFKNVPNDELIRLNNMEFCQDCYEKEIANSQSVDRQSSLSEWVYATPTNAVNTATSYKDRFKKILDFNAQHLPSNVKRCEVKTLTEANDRFLLTYVEYLNTNRCRAVEVFIEQDTDDKWVITEKIYLYRYNGHKEKSRYTRGIGYADLLVALKDYMELPARGSKAYAALL